MFCENCGKNIDDNINFCGNCGLSVARECYYEEPPLLIENEPSSLVSFIKVLTAIMAGLAAPLMILNFFGGIVSGIWLAILGDWHVIIQGVIFLIFSSFAISFALMPSLLFAAPAALAIQKGKNVLGIILSVPALLYTVALITAWCLWVFWLFSSSADGHNLIPLLIWSYGVAISPWSWLAQKESQGGGGEAAIFVTFFAEIACVATIILFLFGINLTTIGVIFASIMVIGEILQLSLLFLQSKYKYY